MRLQTVKLVLKGDKSAAKIAKDLGINQNTRLTRKNAGFAMLPWKVFSPA